MTATKNSRHRVCAGLLVISLLGLGTTEAQESSELDRALQSLEVKPENESEPTIPSDELLSGHVSDVRLRLIDIAADLLLAVGASTERDESLESLQGGGHDPRKRGFTLQSLETSFVGAVDPYFQMEAHLLFYLDPIENESVFELEEAFFTTSQLPLDLDKHGVEVEGGMFLTEFGRINPMHAHAWSWLDQPVIHTRIFGPDGMRGIGARVGWLTPLPWFSELHLGLQNANGETMASFHANDEFFEERPIGGRPFNDQEIRSLTDLAYLVRWDNGWSFSDELSAKAGASALFGPNATGPDGKTSVYGADVVVKWLPVTNYAGWPFVTFEAEIVRRDYYADDFDDGATVLSSQKLEDWGFYAQLLWGFTRNWSTGVRYEFAGGAGESAGDFTSRDDDPFRNDRHRVSPLISWNATEFSRLRLQYNFDTADHLSGNEAHSVWLGAEVLIGKHPKHQY